MLVLAGLSPRLTPSSLCRHFVIDSPCDWSLNSSVCQRRKNILPLKVIKSDRGSLQGGWKWPWEVSNTLSLMWRGFLPVCLPVCTSTTCFDSCRWCLIGPLKNKKRAEKGWGKKSEMLEWLQSLPSFSVVSLWLCLEFFLLLNNMSTYWKQWCYNQAIVKIAEVENILFTKRARIHANSLRTGFCSKYEAS